MPGRFFHLPRRPCASARPRCFAKPRAWRWEDRQVDLWEVKDLPFTEAAVGPVRVVRAEERWEERPRRAGGTGRPARKSQWRWLVSREWDNADAMVIWRIGHQRWGVEKHAFHERTQQCHLTHCPRHEAGVIEAWLLIRVLGFNLFELFVRLHGKPWRQGQSHLVGVGAAMGSRLGSGGGTPAAVERVRTLTPPLFDNAKPRPPARSLRPGGPRGSTEEAPLDSGRALPAERSRAIHRPENSTR